MEEVGSCKMLIQYLVSCVIVDQLNCLMHQKFFMNLVPVHNGMILGRKQSYQQENHSALLLCTQDGLLPEIFIYL